MIVEDSGADGDFNTTEDNLTVSQSFDVTVTPVNDAPVLNDIAASTNEEESVDISLTGTDVDSTTLTYTVTGNPTAGSVSVNNGVATYTPNTHFFGTDSFVITVSDNHPTNPLTDTATVTVTVANQNDAPTLDAINDISILEDAVEQTVLLSGITAGPNESQPLRVTATSNNAGLIADPVVTYVSPDATGSIAFTPTADHNGTTTITVTVEDAGLDGDFNTTEDNLTVSQSFDVTVTPVNDAPTLDAITDISILEDAAEQTVLLSGITDGPNESRPLRIIATSSNTGLIADPVVNYISTDSTGSIAFTPVTDHNGTSTITVTAEDPGADGDFNTTEDNLIVSRSFDVTVTPVNDAPVLDSSASPSLHTIAEDAGAPSGQVGTLVSDLIDTDGSLNNFFDADGDLPGIAITGINLHGGTLWYSTNNGVTWDDVGAVSENSARVLFADNDTRLAFTPATDFNGSISDVVTLKAWDRTGDYANGEADVPTASSLTGTFDTSGQAYGVTLSADGNTAYVADYYSGLQIIDIGDPSAPALTATFDTDSTGIGFSASAFGLALSADGNTIYVANKYTGLEIINISNPSNPTLTATFNTSGNAYGVTLSSDGNTVYVVGGSGGLDIININDPENPTLTGTFDTSGTAFGLALSADGNTAYVADQFDGLQIINISNPSNPTLTATFDTSGDAWGVTLSADGNTAYVTNYSDGLQIIDIGDPSNPTLTATFNTSGNAYGVTLSSDGNTVYVVGGSGGLDIININDPENPTLTGTFDTSGTAFGLALSADGNTAYVADQFDGLQIINIASVGFSALSDTLNITVTSINDAPTLDAIGDISILEDAVEQTVLLSGITDGPSESQSLRIIATSSNTGLIADPVVTYISPDSTGSIAFTPVTDHNGTSTITVTAEDPGADGDFNTTEDNLTVSRSFDVTVTSVNDAPVLNPSVSLSLHTISEDTGAPSGQVGTLVSDLIDTGGSLNNFFDADGDLPGIAITGVNLHGGTLWYSTNNGVTWNDVGAVSENSARVLFADNDTRLAFTPATDFAGSISDVVTLKAWDRTGDYVNGEVDVPTESSLTGALDTLGSAGDVSLSADGNTAYIANGTAGLRIINVSNPSAPALTGTFDTSASGVTLSADGNTAYVTRYSGGLQIIDIGEPSNPTLIGALDTFGHANDVTLSADGNTAYIADGTAGLQIIDVSDPSNPTLTGTFDTSRYAYDVALSTDENTVYIADSIAGLQIIDVGDPSNPTLTGTSTIGRSVYDITLSADGNTAYVADSIGVQIINVSDPSNPTLISTLDHLGDPYGITVSPDGNTVYVANLARGLQIINVSNPSNPTLIGTVGTTGNAQSVTLSVNEKMAYVTDSNGLQIITLVSTEFSDLSDTLSIAVTSINDAPTLDAINDISILEDATEQTVSLSGITDGPNESQPLRITAASSDPGLLADPVVTYASPDSTGSIAFAPTTNQYGTATITVTAEDPGADGDFNKTEDNLTVSRSFDVTVTSVNDAPVLDPSASPSLHTISEDAGAPSGQVGTRVSDLIDTGGSLNNFFDADGDLPGIAITGVNLYGGTLWYSTNNGVTWDDVDAVSDTSPLLLTADAASRLYFEPAANFAGTISDVISFRAWDQTVNRPNVQWDQLGSDIQGESSYDYSGDKVAISTDGTTIAVGARNNSGNGVGAGHVRVFRLSDSVWQQVGNDIDGENAGDQSGFAVSLSGNGNVARDWGQGQ